MGVSGRGRPPRPGGGRSRWRALALAAALAGAVAACGPAAGRAAVSLRFDVQRPAPGDAAVYIDEQYVGPLAYVAARGVRLPVGQHRITVERPGYFPWDRIVEADRAPVRLRVVLVPVPD
ncbi:MAG: PEGA domain-containing protein [Polyangiaceae bacterium]|nr:PEGA domain-containing protein [Polyangiaceae bacterium]